MQISNSKIVARNSKRDKLLNRLFEFDNYLKQCIKDKVVFNYEYMIVYAKGRFPHNIRHYQYNNLERVYTDYCDILMLPNFDDLVEYCDTLIQSFGRPSIYVRRTERLRSIFKERQIELSRTKTTKAIKPSIATQDMFAAHIEFDINSFSDYALKLNRGYHQPGQKNSAYAQLRAKRPRAYEDLVLLYKKYHQILTVKQINELIFACKLIIATYSRGTGLVDKFKKAKTSLLRLRSFNKEK